jgi:hypothetical protein
LSDIDAPIIIKHSDKIHIDFNSLSDLENDQVKTKAGNVYSFMPNHQIIPANDRGEVIITVDCYREEVINDVIEIMVKDKEPSYFIYLKANI